MVGLALAGYYEHTGGRGAVPAIVTPPLAETVAHPFNKNNTPVQLHVEVVRNASAKMRLHVVLRVALSGGAARDAKLLPQRGVRADDLPRHQRALLRPRRPKEVVRGGGGGTRRAPRRTQRRHTHLARLELRREALQARVTIVPGWFHRSLPPQPSDVFGMLRLDGDTYNGTYEALARLYPRLVPGGAVYVDDYGSFKGAGTAVDRYISQMQPMDRPTVTAVREPEGFYDAVWWLKPDPFFGNPPVAVRHCLKQLLT